MVTGTISRIVKDKAFGFIIYREREYFFHKDDYMQTWSQLIEDYNEFGQNNIRVTFDPVDAPKGPRARNVGKTIENNEFPNEPGRVDCNCKILNRFPNESMRDWLKKCMCMNHWMQTDYYHDKGNK